MNNLEFTSELYGRGQFVHSIDELKLPDGFVKYHKANFSKYFCIPEDQFSGLKVLETGCGPGKHAVVLALLGAEVTAFDLSVDNIQRGKKLKAYYELDNLSFAQRNLMEPFRTDKPFDLISCHNWIQHAENPAVILKNLLTNLKLGGRIYLSTYQAATFRFFVTQIARSILKQKHYKTMRHLVKYHFPSGFKGFNNPDDIYMENIFDDFFVPYCHTTTYDIVVHDAEQLVCVPITPKPELGDIRALDNIPLRIGFEKKGDARNVDQFNFTKPVDEFAEPFPAYMERSIELALDAINSFDKQDDDVLSSSFCLGLYRLRSETSRSKDSIGKHNLLQKYLDMALSNSLKPISVFYDTQTLY